MATPDLTLKTKAQLLNLAAKYKIKISRKMPKSEIIGILKKELKKAEKKPKTAKKKVGAGKTDLKKTDAKKAVKKIATQEKKKNPETKSAFKRNAKIQKKAPASPRSASSTGGSSFRKVQTVLELNDPAQEAKFIIAAPEIRDEARAEPIPDLPPGYGDNQLVLLVRDPYWVFLFWELQEGKIEEGLQQLGRSRAEIRWVVRVHPLRYDKAQPFDVDVDPAAGNWYLHLSPPGESFYAEIGFMDPDGNFFSLAVSNTVALPLDKPSEVIDEQWMTTDEEFQKLYALAGGSPGTLSGSEKVAKWAASSSGMGRSPSAPPGEGADRSFRCWLDAELIVYGGANPDAKVTLDGKQVDLRADGTFSTRISLPDGKHSFPVTFQSGDRLEIHTITPTITRKTRNQLETTEN